MAIPIRKALLPSGGHVMLDPKWRTFRLMDGSRQLVSVSKVLGKFFPFDDKKVSEFVAMKNNTTVEAVKAEWLKSAHLGTNVHSAIEATLKGEEIPSFTLTHGQEGPFIEAALEALRKLLEEYDVVAQEAILVSKATGVAGTVDFIARHKKTQRLLVGDWKTSASAMSSFRFGSFQTPADGLLSHLPNAKPLRAAIQVLILGYIMRTEGYSAFYGPQVDCGEVDYGIINIGKDETTHKVVSTFDKVTPLDVLPPDMANEIAADDLIRAIMSGAV